MNALVNALSNSQNRTARTENGAVTLESSLNSNVDYFSLAGAMRGKDMTYVWSKAFSEDAELAARIALWARDVRGGAGERQSFRNFLLWASVHQRDILTRILPKVPHVGRWDDLLVLMGTQYESNVAEIIEAALEARDGLCAKWMPRQGDIAAKLRKRLGYSPKGWRKLLVGLTNVVEQQMCANDWSAINFSHVPSRAFSVYRNAFDRHDRSRFQSFLNAAENGEAKINAGAIFPHDIVYNVYNNRADRASIEQWKQLPDYAAGNEENVIVMADVSGSMGYMRRGTKGPDAMLVSVSLALYTSERLKGPFKDTFITFSTSPKLQKVSGNLADRILQTMTADWSMSTNIQAAFRMILKTALDNSVPLADMPTKLLIISDMEFNSAGEVTNLEAISQQYEAAGYKMPQLVFWNVKGRVGNMPAKYNESGVALVSGYSPSILKALLAGEIKSPQQIMLDTVMNSRYDF